ncbi:MAG: hypothetical protein R3260_17860 [Pseudomonas sp.]|nr:hypothetical protein [Pseudomonas sp.]
MLVDVDGDVITTSKLDSEGSRMIIKKEQEVGGHFDANAKERNENATGWKGDMHKVASIPVVVFEEMCKVAGCNLMKPENRDMLIAMLNNRDYLKLRTKEGRL